MLGANILLLVLISCVLLSPCFAYYDVIYSDDISDNCYEGFMDSWNRFNDSHWIKSYWMSEADKFINTWSPRNVNINAGKLYLQLAMGLIGSHPYSSGEVFSLREYCHGRFEVKAKTSNVCGTISVPVMLYLDSGPRGKCFVELYLISIFTIDYLLIHEAIIEISGCKPRQATFRLFVAGKAMDHTEQLSFDASEDYHVYGIETVPMGGISFQIDGNVIYKEKIPDLRKVKVGSHLYACNNSLPYCEDSIEYNGPTGMSIDFSSYCPIRDGTRGCEPTPPIHSGGGETPPPDVS